jgi:hypothetical protein
MSQLDTVNYHHETDGGNVHGILYEVSKLNMYRFNYSFK